MATAFGAQLDTHYQALVAEIKEVEGQIAERTQHLRQLQLKLESVLELMKLEGIAPPQAHRHFLEVAHDVLLESGPQHYGVLAGALREQGVLIPGAKPEANLLAHISRDDRFVKTGRGMYTVRTTRSERAPSAARGEKTTTRRRASEGKK